MPSCNRIDVDSRLKDAEALINEKPDSALILLRGINEAGLVGNERKARFSLLLSKALDKNSINLTNDSIISPAVEYYSSAGDAYNYFQSLYYLGRVHDNAGNPIKAIDCYARAETLLQKFNDNYAKGQLYLETGLLYERHFDYKQASVDFGKAVKFFRDAGKQQHVDYSLYHQAVAFHTMGNFSSALKKYDECINSYTHNGDTVKIGRCLSSKLILFVEMGAVEKAYATYNELLKYRTVSSLPVSVICVVAKMNVMLGNRDQGIYFLNLAKKRLKTSRDSVAYYDESAFVNAKLENYDKAYFDLNASVAIERKVILGHMSKSLATTHRDTLAEAIKIQKESELYRTRIFIMIIMLGCMIFGFIIWAIIQHRNAKLNTYAGIIDDLHISLENNKGVLSKLFHDQFRFVNDIGSVLLDYENNSQGHKVIYKNVNELISKFHNDKRTFDGLERMVNEYFDNASQKLRAQFDELSENDYRRFCYHTAGFSGKLIALFLDESTVNMYKRKSRLKERITNSLAPDKKLFLECLK